MAALVSKAVATPKYETDLSREIRALASTEGEDLKTQTTKFRQSEDSQWGVQGGCKTGVEEHQLIQFRMGEVLDLTVGWDLSETRHFKAA